jgi:uncharacterized protein YlxW (UPF0749 family)
MAAATVFGLMQFVPVLGVMIPIVALLIPIVAILTRHQRQMAEIIHGRNAAALEAEVTSLREELRELKDRLRERDLALAELSQDQQSSISLGG